MLLGTTSWLKSTTSYTGEVAISHNEQEDRRKSVAAASATAAVSAGAVGASVASCLRRSSFHSSVCCATCPVGTFVSRLRSLTYSRLCLFTGVSRNIHICQVELTLVQDDATTGIYCSSRGFSEEVMAAEGTGHKVDAGHPNPKPTPNPKG